VQLKIHDREQYDLYQAGFWNVFKQYQGKLLSSDENVKVIEGEWPSDKLVLIEFPSEEAFYDWSKSPEYLHIAKNRIAGADTTIILSHQFSLTDAVSF
jgi:uncharacterized protein (DUF1330 family)